MRREYQKVIDAELKFVMRRGAQLRMKTKRPEESGRGSLRGRATKEPDSSWLFSKEFVTAR